MRFTIICLFAIVCAISAACTPEKIGKIDRRAVVERHNVETTSQTPTSPAQVGNGNFAFGADITGLQTFSQFNTISNWGWHSSPIPRGIKLEDFKGTDWTGGNRKINYCTPDDSDPLQKKIGAYLAANPHRLNLARIGFEIKKSNGENAKFEDLKNARQKIDLWSGAITSRFEFDGESVEVETACHPERDMLAVRVKSALLKDSKISVFISFPYGDEKYYALNVGDFDKKSAHSTRLIGTEEGAALFKRTLDGTEFFAAVNSSTPTHIVRNESDEHKFHIVSEGESLDFVCQFSPKTIDIKSMPDAAETISASAVAWEKFWNTGAAIDFSQSLDPRWKELERRAILSQYIMKVNESGSLPPQESGLAGNTWFGRFHFEMIPSHTLHYLLWNRPELAQGALSIYKKFLPTAIERAKKQGYAGARYPKCTADFDREWPHPIHATLIWQQPHPIYFAESEYKINPSQSTLEKWKDIVFASAYFIADLPVLDAKTGQYNLEPPLFIVSENTNLHKTRNPAFELAYWRYALSTALEWQRRLGLEETKKWRTVLENLAPLPIQNGVYVTHEGIEDMWTKYNFEHPALIGIYGLLPDTGIDKTVFKNTLAKVSATWNFDKTWGWDFPMLALAAARTGDGKAAIDFLLHKSAGFQFDVHGLATGGPFPYMPSNGSLLSAIAIMAKGNMFPADWNVKYEGFNPYQ